jgi:hypothetical protein
MFDEVLAVEESAYQRGLKEGYCKGDLEGFESGRAIGVEKASEIHAEIAGYRGVCKGMQMVDLKFNVLSSKERRILNWIIDVTTLNGKKSFLEDKNFWEILDQVRAKFKTLLSILGVHSHQINEADLSF